MNESKLRALSIFDDYVDLPNDGQARMREQLAQRDPELLTALLSLVAAAQAPSPLDTGALDIVVRLRPSEPPAPAEDPRVGTRLGPWRIDRVVAEGGMGTIYSAHRDDGQYDQRVALKCIRSKLTSPGLVEAFLSERRHLAGLDHPGIATLLDGGVDEQGQPWFAMRFVEGIAIDRWCGARSLDVRARVRLLAQACDAVDYAHAHGVLHRDLKPSNLLVTEDGRVLLVDFGISSAIAENASAAAPQIAVSRAYAAPEVLAGGAYGAAGDVYGMGALMYRLLCAGLPVPEHGIWSVLPGAQASEPETLAALAARASTETANRHGAADAAALTRQLSGDLSAIAVKAVAAQPQQRYASMRALAEDLQRWFEHMPVEARAGERFYRAGKFLRRHRLAVGFIAALTWTLAFALGNALWQQRLTAKEAEATRTVSQLFATTLGNAALAGLGSAPFSSKQLLDKTERELRKLPLSEQPVLHARSLATLARSYAVIGEYRYAEALASEAQRILGDNHDQDGYVAATQLSLLNTRAKYAQAAELARGWMAELGERSDKSAHLARANFEAQLAIAQWGLADPYGGLRTLDAALSQIQALGAGNEELLAQLLIQRSDFNTRLYRYKQATADIADAIARAEAINPVLADDAREQQLRISLAKMTPPDLGVAERLLASRQRTLGEHHPQTGMARILLGASQYVGGKVSDSRQQVSLGKSLIEAGYGRNHPAYAYALMIGATVAGFDSPDNIAPFREALRVYERTLGPRHVDTLVARNRLASRVGNFAPSLGRSDVFDETKALFEENLRYRHEANLPAPWDSLNLGILLIRRGADAHLPQAETLLRQSRIDAQRYYSPEEAYVYLTRSAWTELRYLQNHTAWADQEFEKIEIEHRGKTSVSDIMATHHALLYRAAYAFETCRKADAERLLTQAYEFDLGATGADGYLTRDARAYLDALRKHGVLRNDDLGSYLHPALAGVNARAKSCSQR
ncbi:MAG: protein kinase domain-containing protein [Lysobacter sp.]